jgi:DNA-binding HxlR family transcriptional regulator
MSPKDFSAMECSVARTLDVIGDKWSLLILRDAFYGVRRFDDFQLDLGVARNILTDRLNKMVHEGVLSKQPYQERPPRYEYRLTEKGRDLFPVLLTMMRWGDRWSKDRSLPPVTLTHTACGHETQPMSTCSHCGKELVIEEVRAHPIRVRMPVEDREALAAPVS